METDIGTLIEDETARRLAVMSEPGYEFPPKAGVWDWVGIAAIIVVSTVLIVCCVTGVIS